MKKGLDPLEYTMVSSSRQFIDAQIVEIRQVQKSMLNYYTVYVIETTVSYLRSNQFF